MPSKRCSKCGETKTLAEFHRNRTGLRADCKECSRAYQRAYRESHREEIRARDRAYARAYNEAHREERRACKRAYYEAYKEERNTQIRKRKTEVWKTSREVANRNGEPWTPAEDHVVLTSEGTELDIAIELGRTTNSVGRRRRKLRSKAVTA